MKKDVSSSFLAYTQIKGRIIDVTYQPGERLSETKLAEEFGLGRSPIRTALSRLESEGWVEISPQSGTFVCSQACLPELIRSAAAGRNAHILTLSPPLNMQAKWFAGHVAYTMSKYGMSMCTLGMSAELKADGIAVNSLWPRTTIATAAVQVHFPEAILKASDWH